MAGVVRLTLLLMRSMIEVSKGTVQAAQQQGSVIAREIAAVELRRAVEFPFVVCISKRALHHDNGTLHSAAHQATQNQHISCI